MNWLKELNADELRAAFTRSAIDVVDHFKGRISEFDLRGVAGCGKINNKAMPAI
ncbi:hypothetical protein JW960_28165 [candidate division KSB1 bacterium]|nr:hypothetical protein [candidate division KSB1 bacterium]